MNHNWYAVITAPVLLSKELTDKQKLLIALIANLSNEKGYCFASNKYLGDCLNCSERYIRDNLLSLEEKKIVGRIVKLNNKKEVEYRAIMLSLENLTPPEPQFPTPGTTVPHPSGTTVPHNNKVLKTNNKNNSTISPKVDIVHSTEQKNLFGEHIQSICSKEKKEKSARAKKFSESAAVTEFFHEFYLSEKNTKYEFQDKDFGNMSNLRKSIRKKLIEEGNESPTPEEVAKATCFFIKASYHNGSEWFRNEFTPTLVYSQFNQSYSKLKNGINGNSKQKPSIDSIRGNLERIANGVG